jgi:hypothetical protein
MYEIDKYDQPDMKEEKRRKKKKKKRTSTSCVKIRSKDWINYIRQNQLSILILPASLPPLCGITFG